MTIQNLPDNSPVRSQVLPSVWAGYKDPSCRPVKEMVEQVSQAFQEGYDLCCKELVLQHD